MGQPDRNGQVLGKGAIAPRSEGEIVVTDVGLAREAKGAMAAGSRVQLANHAIP